ncbi:MAG: hypothetical protein ACM3OB_05910, partial [Acidobacteriota bacterium]
MTLDRRGLLLLAVLSLAAARVSAGAAFLKMASQAGDVTGLGQSEDGTPLNTALEFSQAPDGAASGTIVDPPPQTFLWLDSQPGEPLGGGQTKTFTPLDGPLTAASG